ncbi:MAG: NAD(FAD)-dependent dehydrogenase, partial [Microcoleus sp. SIO2G3]|nr:NAD(FAD)-dependent dehydrogenase [Microcoleus sp. SIO2G3]
CDFMAFYVKDDRILAVAASQRDTQMAAIAELMRLDRMPIGSELHQEIPDFSQLLGEIG